MYDNRTRAAGDGTIAFTGTSWIAGLATHHSSVTENAISNLAASRASTHAAMTVAFVVYGVGILFFASALRVTLGGPAWCAAAAAGVAALGLAAARWVRPRSTRFTPGLRSRSQRRRADSALRIAVLDDSRPRRVGTHLADRGNGVLRVHDGNDARARTRAPAARRSRRRAPLDRGHVSPSVRMLETSTHKTNPPGAGTGITAPAPGPQLRVRRADWHEKRPPVLERVLDRGFRPCTTSESGLPEA